MNDKFNNLPLRNGVGIIVLNKNDKVFVAKRIDNPKNYWQMPQGGIDKGEDPLKDLYPKDHYPSPKKRRTRKTPAKSTTETTSCG